MWTVGREATRRALLASVVVVLFLVPGCLCSHPRSAMVYEDDDLPWGEAAHSSMMAERAS